MTSHIMWGILHLNNYSGFMYENCYSYYLGEEEFLSLGTRWKLAIIQGKERIPMRQNRFRNWGPPFKPLIMCSFTSTHSLILPLSFDDPSSCKSFQRGSERTKLPYSRRHKQWFSLWLVSLFPIYEVLANKFQCFIFRMVQAAKCAKLLTWEFIEIWVGTRKRTWYSLANCLVMENLSFIF